MMKRLIFIVAMLWSVAYGQTPSKGYLRYDSLYIQKIGGNGELILENGTRTVTGGVLTNVGNGRTKFVVPTAANAIDSIWRVSGKDSIFWRRNGTTFAIKDSTGGGGGSQDLSEVLIQGNSSDTIIRNAGIQANDTYGLIWSDNFTGGSLGANYVDASASTETFTGAGLELDGTANVYTNAYYRVDSTSEQNTTEYIRFQVKEVSADSYGVLIGMGNLNALCCDHHLYGGVSLTNGTKTLRIQTEGSGFVYNDATALTIAVNDTVEISTVFDGWNATVKYYNWTTKVRHSFTLTGVPQGSVLPTTPKGFSRSALIHLGGNILIHNWSRYSDESRNAKTLWIGESLINPGGNLTDPSQRLPYLLARGNTNDVIIYGGGGSVAYYNRAGIASDFPRYSNIETVYLTGLGNDTLFSVYENQGKLAYRRQRDYWVGQGKRVVHVITTPRDATPIGAIDTWIKAEFASDVIISLYDRYRNGGTTFPAPWDAGDGVHWTAAFNIDAARYIDSFMTALDPAINQRHYTGEVNANHGKFKKLSLTGQYEFNYTASPITATIPNDASLIYINPSSTIASLTIRLPYAVDSGHVCFIKFGGTLTTGVVVTGLTISTDATQSVISGGFVNYNNAVNAFGVGDWIACTYKGQNRWDLIPIQTYAYTDVTINGHAFGRGNLSTAQSNLRGGYFAGHSWTTGSSGNVAYGPSSQQLGTTGVRNTAVGNESLMNRQGASSNNTAVGEEALRNGTSGSGQTIVGHAGGFAATGADIAGLGINVLFDNTTGASNVALGPNTGRGITTGSNNLALGDNINGFSAAQAGTVAIGANGLRRIWVNSSGRLTFGGNGGVTNTDTTNADFYVKYPAGNVGAAAEGSVSGTLTTNPKASAREYNNAFYQTTNALNRYGLGGVIFSSSATVTNSGTSPTTFSTYTTKANTLAATEETLLFQYVGTVDDASPCTLALSFAGTSIGSFAPAGGGMSWEISGRIVRSGASTATAIVVYHSNSVSQTTITKLTGLTFSGTNILLLTGTSATGATDDLTKEMAEISWRPAAAN